MQRNNESGNGRIRVVITAGITVAGIAAAVCLLKLLVPEKDGDAGQADARQEIVVVEIGEENEGEEWKAEAVLGMEPEKKKGIIIPECPWLRK